MNVLLISYGIKEYDGRLTEIYNVAKKIGDVTLVCCGNSKCSNVKEKIVDVNKSKYLSLRLYISFLLTCLKAAKEMGGIDILFSDNLFASIPALIIRKLFKPKVIVQDVRELYFYKDIKNISGRLFCKYETVLMKKSDVVLCANYHRSKIMFEQHKLKTFPLVFENIRFLTGEYDKKVLDEKYSNCFKYKVNIVSTGGLSVLRTTDKLVFAMTKLSNDYGLYIIGDGTDEDNRIIQYIIDTNNLTNVMLIPKVPLEELRYIVQRCDIGIVSYHKKDLNNKYCASGKVYEYLAEGLPIVTTENLPLKDLCVKYGVGESDDCFYKGIVKVSNNMSDYRQRVESYVSSISVDKNNSKIACEILKIINSEVIT